MAGTGIASTQFFYIVRDQAKNMVGVIQYGIPWGDSGDDGSAYPIWSYGWREEMEDIGGPLQVSNRKLAWGSLEEAIAKIAKRVEGIEDKYSQPDCLDFNASSSRLFLIWEYTGWNTPHTWRLMWEVEKRGILPAAIGTEENYLSFRKQAEDKILASIRKDKPKAVFLDELREKIPPVEAEALITQLFEPLDPHAS